MQEVFMMVATIALMLYGLHLLIGGPSMANKFAKRIFNQIKKLFYGFLKWLWKTAEIYLIIALFIVLIAMFYLLATTPPNH